jgi:tetratricopeptide (TPR) repeat protein
MTSIDNPLDRGLRAIEQGDPELAAYCLNEVLRDEAPAAQTQLSHAVLREITEKKDDRLRQIVFEYRVPALNILLLALANGLVDHVLTWTADLLERAPTDIGLLGIQSIAYEATGDFGRAIRACDSMIDADASNPAAFYRRALVRMNAAERQKNDELAVGDREAALADLDVVIRLAPEEPDAYLARGRARASAGDLDGAEADFTTTIALSPEYVEAHNERGLLREARGHFEGALEDYERVLELAPESAVAYRNRGDARLALEQFPAAIEDYTTAIKLLPEFAEAFVTRGDAHMAAGDQEEDVASASALASYRSALSDYDAALKVVPDLPDAVIGRARVWARQGELDRAVQEYSRLASEDPPNVDAINERGIVRKAAGKDEEALDDFREVVHLAPDSPVGHQNLADLLATIGRTDEALRAYNEALRLEDDSLDALLGRADVRVVLEDYAGAIRDLDRAIELGAGNASAYRARAEALINHSASIDDPERYVEKARILNRVLDDCERADHDLPDDPWVSWYRGLALRGLEGFDEAVAAFDEALRRVRASQDIDSSLEARLLADRADALRQWGEALELPDKLEGAIEAANEAGRFPTPDEEMAWIDEVKGLALLALKRHDEALAVFEKWRGREPESEWAIINTGMAALFMGDHHDADRRFRQVLDKTSDAAVALWARIGLGLALGGLGDANRASEVLDATLALPPTPAALVERSAIFEAFREHSRAEEDLRRALEIGTPEANTCNSLAWFLVRLPSSDDRYLEAVELATRAVELEGDGPDRGNFLDTLGWAYARLGSFARAVPILEEAASISPHDSMIRAHLRSARHRTTEPT